MLLADAAAATDHAAVLGLVGTVTVAVITAVGGVLAVRAARGQSATTPGPELTRLLADVYEDVDNLHLTLDGVRDEVRLWKSRAEQLGWQDPA